MYHIYFPCLGKYSFTTSIGKVLRLVLGPKPRHLQTMMPMLTLAMMMRMEMLCATYLLMERTTIWFRGWTNLLRGRHLLDAPEDRGPGPLLQWAGGGLHGGADGSKQVLTGGDQRISLVLEIEDPLFLNVQRCWPGVSRDDFSWTCAISWKTTNDAPSNLSLAIAVCSWPELIPAIETGNRSTMFCIACRYKVSIHTQVLQGRVSSKFFRSIISNEAYTKKGLQDEDKETLQKTNTSRRSKYREGRSTKLAQWKEEESKEVIGSGKENDEVTVVLETKQTKNYSKKQVNRKSCSSSE